MRTMDWSGTAHTPKERRRLARQREKSDYASLIAAHPEYAPRRPSWRLRALRGLLWAVMALSVLGGWLWHTFPYGLGLALLAVGFYGLCWAYDR